MNGIIDFKNCNRKTFLLKGMVELLELLLSSIEVFSYEQNRKLFILDKVSLHWNTPNPTNVVEDT